MHVWRVRFRIRRGRHGFFVYNSSIRSVFYLSLSLNLLFIACASKPSVATWIIGKDGIIVHNADKTVDSKTCAELEGYRCYSEEDDEFIRDRMALCCGQAGL
jgi:hypothetical protein